MRQDHVLLMADAQLIIAEAFGQIGQHPHLIRGCIAGCDADGLGRDRKADVIGAFMDSAVGVEEGPQRGG